MGDRDSYMTTGLPGINDCIPDRAMVSDYGNPPRGGNFRLSVVSSQKERLRARGLMSKVPPSSFTLQPSTLIRPQILPTVVQQPEPFAQPPSEP